MNSVKVKMIFINTFVQPCILFREKEILKTTSNVLKNVMNKLKYAQFSKSPTSSSNTNVKAHRPFFVFGPTLAGELKCCLDLN